MSTTIIANTETVYAAARGCYQRELLRGTEGWSGSTLRGKAARYGGRYAASRRGLLNRIADVADTVMVPGRAGRCGRVVILPRAGDAEHTEAIAAAADGLRAALGLIQETRVADRADRRLAWREVDRAVAALRGCRQ